MAINDYDFCGWATKNNIRCSDGRTIMKDAFKENDGKKVPLVWSHDHDTPEAVLGHAVLENRDEGVYAYCKFNGSENGKTAKLLVQHGDIDSMSIYANQLKENMNYVMHGNIREVSLVLASANPGAFIENVIVHSDDSDGEVIIYSGEGLILAHDGISEESSLAHADSKSKEETNMAEDSKKSISGGKKTIGDVFNTLNEEQKNAVYAIIGSIVEDDKEEDDDDMKHNVFDVDNRNDENVLSHDAMDTIIKDGKRFGSLKESFLAHAQDYGIENIDYLFPDAQNVTNKPEFISREMSWVNKVIGGVHHTPFSRIKSIFADITEDEARAKGYIKGKLKKEEVFSLLKRTTNPTTIYKKQKLDRDDVIDITDFDVVAWLKSEMRMMLDEEIARAILIGDGRLASSDDKINEQNIRPIANDADLYTIKVDTGMTGTAIDGKAFINAAIRARKNYKGSGQPTLFTTEDVVTEMLLLEDTTGRRIYNNISDLATTLRVKEIVTVEVMEGHTRDDAGTTKELLGLIVNLADYNVGADKGGSINMFEDFDIDYNQQKYLIETRCSGALVKPHSAIALERTKTGA